MIYLSLVNERAVRYATLTCKHTTALPNLKRDLAHTIGKHSLPKSVADWSPCLLSLVLPSFREQVPCGICHAACSVLVVCKSCAAQIVSERGASAKVSPSLQLLWQYQLYPSCLGLCLGLAFELAMSATCRQSTGRPILLACCWLVASLSRALALKNGLALKPPMGYNTWNAFHGDIDEDVVKSTADLMVELMLKDAGYEYLVMDGKHSTSPRASPGCLQV